MVTSKRLSGGDDLAKEVDFWIRMEEENREFKSRVVSALDEIKDFVGRSRLELERRKSKLIQSSGFKEETRSMEAALANIQQLVISGRNVSGIFAAIDGFLTAHKGEDTIAREHIRLHLADARDNFMCSFHDSIRGSRLSELLDILYFMPYSFWRVRGAERRNFRSPSAAEVLKLLGECGRQGIDVNGMDIVLLAAVIRMKLGISPRMDYHAMSSNKLAEQLMAEESIARLTSQRQPLDESFCRTTGGILANIRRWNEDLLGGAWSPAPPEIEAEMLQVVYLANDSIRISGTEPERAADFLWLLSTVIASGQAALKDVLSWPTVKNSRYASARERIAGVKAYLDGVAVLTDRTLLARWSEAKKELDSLTVRSDAIALKSKHEYGEYAHLEELKEQRSDVVKSLIKMSDSLQLVEPALLDVLALSDAPSKLPLLEEHLRQLDPAKLRGRNHANLERTKLVARQELEKLRLLIGRITVISRKGFSDSAAQVAQERLHTKERLSRKTTDGVEIGKIPTADLHEKLLGSLRKAAVSVRECKGRIENARKRTLKTDIQRALNMMLEKTSKAIEVFDSVGADDIDEGQAPEVFGKVFPVLRDVVAAQINFSTRVNSVKVPPAEKMHLTPLLYAVKRRLGDDLRDIESIRSELAERSADSATRPQEDATMISAVQQMADLAVAANKAFVPVSTMINRLNDAIASQKQGSQALHPTAQDMKDTITDALAVMNGKLTRIEALASDFDMPMDAYVVKFERWRNQLVQIGLETERIVEVLDDDADIQQTVIACTALEREISAAFESLQKNGTGAGDLPPIRDRGRKALETIASSLTRLRVARDTCATAAGADWRVLRTAAAYLERHGEDLAALETELEHKRSRIEQMQALASS